MSISGHLSGSLSGRLSGLLSGSAGGAPPFVPPIGMQPLALWDARTGMSPVSGRVPSWQDVIGGLLLEQAISSKQPTLAVDGPYFAGKPVLQFDGLDDFLATGLLSAPLAPIGTRPYWVWVFRLRTTNTATVRSLGYGTDAAITRSTAVLRCPSGSDGLESWIEGVGTVLDPTPIITTQHIQETWIYSGAAPETGLFSQRDGATPVSSANSNPLAYETQRMNVGSDYAGGSNVPLSLAMVACYPARPSDAQRDALRAYCQSVWGVPSQLPPLPASALDYWHSELGCSSSGWTSQMRGIPTPATGAPVVGVDAGYFNGRVVAQTRSAPKQTYRANPSSQPIITAGQFPYIFCVMRSIAAAPASVGHAISITSGGTERLGLYYSAANWRTRQGNLTLVPPTVTTNVAVVEMWFDAATSYGRINGSETSAASASSGTMLCVGIGFGTQSSGDMQDANINHAFYLLCSSKPTDPEIAALRAWATAYWGAP